MRELLGMMEMFCVLVAGWVYNCVHVKNTINFSTLNGCSLLYKNYIPIKKWDWKKEAKTKIQTKKQVKKTWLSLTFCRVEDKCCFQMKPHNIIICISIFSTSFSWGVAEWRHLTHLINECETEAPWNSVSILNYSMAKGFKAQTWI